MSEPKVYRDRYGEQYWVKAEDYVAMKKRNEIYREALEKIAQETHINPYFQDIAKAALSEGQP